MRRRLVVAIALALAGIASSGARAHIGHDIARAERYLKLDASEADTRLVVSLMLGPEEGQRVLAAADADGDGSVTRSEADAYLESWADGLRTELPVRIDGEPIETRWVDGWLDPIGRVRRVGLTVEMVTHLPTERAEARIELEDRMVRRETFDRTDVAFRARDGAALLACGTVPEPPDCLEPELAIVRGGAQPALYTARVRYAGRRDSPAWLPLAGGGALLLFLTTLALSWMRRRARSSR